MLSLSSMSESKTFRNKDTTITVKLKYITLDEAMVIIDYKSPTTTDRKSFTLPPDMAESMYMDLISDIRNVEKYMQT